MRRLFIGAMLIFLLSFPVARTASGQDRLDFRSERKDLKTRQTREWRTLKAQQRAQRRSWGGAHMTRAQRAQLKHVMKRDKAALRQQQRNDRQDLRDRERLIKERTRQAR